MNTSREVLKTALQMLQLRFYSKQELAEKLRRKGAAEEALQEALTQLEEWNYLNDQRLCKRQVLLKVQEGRYGRLRIEQILRQKGFAGEDVAEAWAAQEDELPAEEERALRLLQKRFRAGGEEEQRLLRFLWQRGFSASVARRTVALYLADNGASS